MRFEFIAPGENEGFFFQKQCRSCSEIVRALLIVVHGKIPLMKGIDEFFQNGCSGEIR